MVYIYRRGEVLDREPVAPYVLRDPEPPPQKLPDKKKYRPELCWTTRGYWQHRRYGTEKCDACLEVQSIHAAAYRAKQKIRRTKPEITTPPSKIGSEKPQEKGALNGAH